MNFLIYAYKLSGCVVYVLTKFPVYFCVRPAELDLNASRGVEHTIHRALIDPGGRHSLASVCSTAGAENYYIHAKWKKPRPLNKLKGLVINAVAWNRQLISDGEILDLLGCKYVGRPA